MHFCLLDRTQKSCWPFLLWEAFYTPTPSYDPYHLTAFSPSLRDRVMLAQVTLPFTAPLLYY
jgi:hypothetical protein